MLRELWRACTLGKKCRRSLHAHVFFCVPFLSFRVRKAVQFWLWEWGTVGTWRLWGEKIILFNTLLKILTLTEFSYFLLKCCKLFCRNISNKVLSRSWHHAIDPPPSLQFCTLKFVAAYFTFYSLLFSFSFVHKSFTYPFHLILTFPSHIFCKIIRTMETKQVNSLLLRTVLNSCLVFSQVNMYRLYVTFILVQPFTVKHGNELLNSSPKQFAIIMAAKWPGLVCNRLFLSGKNSHFQNKAANYLSFICMRIKSHFHINGLTLNLALKKRLGVILINVQFSKNNKNSFWSNCNFSDFSS